MEVKGTTGTANQCPTIDSYTGKKFCSEPTFFTASGQVASVGSDGSVIFKEEDEIASVRERVPFLFTVKQLEASGKPNNDSGKFFVPSYPKGRGGSTGVIQWLCLPEAEVTRKFCRRRTSRTRPLLWKRGLVEDHKEQPETVEVIEVFESL
ncbi:LOW QUALITY PROTEIN: hypothetical protein HID58_035123 [Brassica napus]|uniref:Uncharacterized protein n=1 Tax=Brassica napus TaxID=3708 RepID=A0ABQ8C421_BRANA|nr:LOW QUALITY PROTEIN: hypothetical protein HID58_035123 [Brassica napus]